jgi:ribosomal protein L37AE/L43A
METNGNKIMQKLCKNYSCESCDYNTVRKSSYTSHLLSARHKREISGTKIMQKMCNLIACPNCNKVYKTTAGLWKHKNKCPSTNVADVLQQNHDILQQNQELNKILIEQTKQTTELQTQVIELCKKGIHHTTNNTTNKNTFNLNFFLNETCKDAMNLEDFINSIVWKIADLKMVGDMGYVKGFSKLITDKLSLIAEDKRPIHCTDAKREVMYVKDDDKWEKEPETNPKLCRAVKKASRPQIVLPVLTEFRELNPDYKICESNVSTEYQMMISEALCGGDGENEVESVVKNISKKVIINKV